MNRSLRVSAVTCLVAAACACSTSRDFSKNGDAGGAGAGGGGSEAGCERDADCAAADACNEAASCQGGECVAGASRCGEFDADHCACVVRGEACAVAAADLDGDGVGSAACEVAPGEDCDDAQATVYPGAEELCDGLDNDCDGLRDLDDGLEPFVRRVNVPGGNSGGLTASLAWSPEANAYGVAWVAPTNKSGGPTLDVHFGLIHLDGTFESKLTSVIPGTTSSFIQAEAIKLSYGHGEFGLAALDVRSNQKPLLEFRRISATGTATLGVLQTHSSELSSPSDVDLFRTSADDWLVTYQNFDSDSQRRSTYQIHVASGVLDAESAETALPDNLDAFAQDAGALVAARSASSANDWEVLWAALEPGGALPTVGGRLATSSMFQGVFSGPGQAVAAATRDTDRGVGLFNSVTAQARACEAVETPFLSDVLPGDVVQLPGGWAIVSTQGAYRLTDLQFSQVFDDCSASLGFSSQAVDLDGEAPGWNYGIKAAGNGNGLAVMWAQALEGDPLRVALFGPHICDAPDR